MSKVNPKYIKVIDVRPQYINYIEGNTCRNLHDIECRNIFSNSMLLTKKMKRKVNK